MQHLSSRQASPSPAAGLWRIVGYLTPEQTRQFTREIKLVSGALASERPRTGTESGAPAPEGVRSRHSLRCPSRHSGVCGCSPRWEAWVYSRRDKAKVRKTFSEHWEAKAWRHEQLELASINRLRVDPTRGLRLPASTGRRERIATPDEARRLIEALRPRDRGLWATAMYAGPSHTGFGSARPAA